MAATISGFAAGVIGDTVTVRPSRRTTGSG
jgi:hypothetical protein